MLERRLQLHSAKRCAAQLAGHRGTLSTVPVSDRQLAVLSTVCHFVAHTGNKNALTQYSNSQRIRGYVSAVAASKFYSFYYWNNVLLKIISELL